MNHGISTLQGPHHVAQKSISTTLPLSDVSFTSLLFRSLSVKFRFAGFALAGHAPAAATSSWPKGHSGTAGRVRIASASAPTVATVQRSFMFESPVESV